MGIQNNLFCLDSAWKFLSFGVLESQTKKIDNNSKKEKKIYIYIYMDIDIDRYINRGTHTYLHTYIHTNTYAGEGWPAGKRETGRRGNGLRYTYKYIYIFIYICVCVCVRAGENLYSTLFKEYSNITILDYSIWIGFKIYTYIYIYI